MVSLHLQCPPTVDSLCLSSINEMCYMLDEKTKEIIVPPQTLINTGRVQHPMINSLKSGLIHLNVSIEILQHCNMQDLMRVAQTNSVNRSTVKEYIQDRLNVVGNRFFGDANMLLEVLRTCDAVISSEAVLHFLLPEHGTTWSPSRLDIFIPASYRHRVYTLLGMNGYKMASDRPTPPGSRQHSQIVRVTEFLRGDEMIAVTVSTTAAAFAPIFELENTALMNLISYDRLYCAYPTLTFSNLAMINPGQLYTQRFSVDNMKTLLKYRTRQFEYVSCHNNQEIYTPCFTTTRSITDANGIWWDLEQAIEVKSSPADIFQRFGMLDVHWTLGGPVCKRPDALMLPDVRIIDDNSYVRNACRYIQMLTGSTSVLFITRTDSWEANLPTC